MRELSIIMNDALFMLRGPRGGLTIPNILAIYMQYLDWYNLLPEFLRLGQDFTPSGLFLQ